MWHSSDRQHFTILFYLHSTIQMAVYCELVSCPVSVRLYAMAKTAIYRFSKNAAERDQTIVNQKMHNQIWHYRLHGDGVQFYCFCRTSYNFVAHWTVQYFVTIRIVYMFKSILHTSYLIHTYIKWLIYLQITTLFEYSRH